MPGMPPSKVFKIYKKNLKGNNMAQIKIHNGGYYAHAQTSNAYNFCLS